MKTHSRILFVIMIFTATIYENANAQSDISGLSGIGHVGASGYYLGWDAFTGIPLEIRTDNTYPINFYTNYATTSTFRMTILSKGKVAVNNSSAKKRILPGL